MSWFGGTIQFGRGRNVGADVLLTWTDTDPRRVDPIALGSLGNTALWEYYEPKGTRAMHRCLWSA